MNDKFDFIREEGFEQTFFYIERAMDKYHKDSAICCMLFRQALESAINDIYTILKINAPSDYSLNKQCYHIKQIIPDEFYDNILHLEIYNVHKICNKYAHFNKKETLDANKDKKTCYCGMQYICRWIINFSKEYPNYLLEQEKEREKQKEEEDKKYVLNIIKIIIASISITGILAFIFRTKN